MAYHKIRRAALLSACAEIGPEDGRDPRLERRDAPRKVPNRKALQLCAQVARTLASLFAAECGDEVLRDLQVESVVPAPNASRLLVSVSLAWPANSTVRQQAAEHLERARGKLRSEVAAAVNRRRVPDLVFRIIEPMSE
jgi:ribosome-binding factor A